MFGVRQRQYSGSRGVPLPGVAEPGADGRSPRRLRWLRPRGGRPALISAGVVLVAGALALLGATASLVWGLADEVEDAQRALGREFDRSVDTRAGEDGLDAWARVQGRGPAHRKPRRSAAPRPGQPIARMEIPRIGERWMVVEGIAERHLRAAPGHFPRTALPGEVGNFAVAGHRVRGMFWDLDKVREGDPIGVQTRTRWYVYRVSAKKIVRPKAIEVIAPVPGRPGVWPTRANLTLTTCEPKWGNSRRLIVHAELVHSQPRGWGVPKELSR